MDYDRTREYTVAEWNDGWFVEAPHPRNATNSIQIAGPFREQRDAEQFIRNAQDRACGL